MLRRRRRSRLVLRKLSDDDLRDDSTFGCLLREGSGGAMAMMVLSFLYYIKYRFAFTSSKSFSVVFTEVHPYLQTVCPS